MSLAVQIENKDTNTLTPHFRAIAGKNHSFGRTMGEALDALISKEGVNIDSSTILIQRFAPDAYFTQNQYDRMKELLGRRSILTESENNELILLIDTELEATVARTDAFVNGMNP